MAIYFLDTSAAVKRYAREIGTDWLQALVTPSAGHLLFISRITRVETISALTRREKSTGSQQSYRAINDFEYDFKQHYRVVELISDTIDRAAELAKKYALRGYDAVQLSAAMEVCFRLKNYSVTLVSADNDLNKAALNLGLTV